MNTSGEVADLMAKEAIQMTESAVKLTALGVKNLAAIVMALANDDGKTEGVAKLKQMLKTGKQLCIMQIKEADLKKFNAEAKNYGIMYRPVADKTNDKTVRPVRREQTKIRTGANLSHSRIRQKRTAVLNPQSERKLRT